MVHYLQLSPLYPSVTTNLNFLRVFFLQVKLKALVNGLKVYFCETSMQMYDLRPTRALSISQCTYTIHVAYNFCWKSFPNTPISSLYWAKETCTHCTMPPQWSAPHRIVPTEELAAHGLSGDFQPEITGRFPTSLEPWWSWQYMGVSKNRGGPPKWMVYNEKAY